VEEESTHVVVGQWTNADFVDKNLPTELDGVSVKVNGIPAYVYYISPTQLNVLAPDDTVTGQVQVQVTNPSGTSNRFSANESAVSPAAFFVFTAKYPAAVHTSGVLVGKAGLIAGANFAPAKPGETPANSKPTTRFATQSCAGRAQSQKDSGSPSWKTRCERWCKTYTSHPAPPIEWVHRHARADPAEEDRLERIH